MEDIKTLLGRRIRYLRTLRGMTQQKLGEKVDLNYKYLGAVERGEKNPSIDNLAKIAEGLNVELHEIFIIKDQVEDTRILKRKIDEFLKAAGKKEIRTIYRVIEAILK
jgi:transcriptional regulator with XRE-family HTH domain